MDFKSALSHLLGRRIREARQKVDVNQELLGAKIGLSRTSISNIEAGRQLAPLDVLYNICHVLGTELHFLLPIYTEVIQFIGENDSTIDKLKTNNVSDSSIEVVRNIIDRHKHQ